MTDLDGCLKWMGDLERTLARLDILPRRVAEIAAPAITSALQKEFARGEDPYGRRWRKLSTGKPSHLTETSRLRRGTKATAMPGKRAGLRIQLGAPYAIFHQTGTVNMPARRILPQRGMPASWSLALRAAHKRAFAEAVR